MDNNTPYIGIGRASTVIQKNSLEIQFEGIKRWSEQHHIPVILDKKNFVFESGKKKNRDTINGALALIKEGKARGVVFTRLDRLGRSTEEICRIVREIVEAGGDVIGTEQMFDTRTAIGMFVLRTLASFAELEHALISERIAEGKAAKKAKKGYFSKGHIGWGYKLNASGKVVEHKEEQAFIKRVAAMRESGMSWARIADALTAEAAPKRKKGASTKWGVAEVQRLLGAYTNNKTDFGLGQNKTEQVA